MVDILEPAQPSREEGFRYVRSIMTALLAHEGHGGRRHLPQGPHGESPLGWRGGHKQAWGSGPLALPPEHTPGPAWGGLPKPSAHQRVV